MILPTLLPEGKSRGRWLNKDRGGKKEVEGKCESKTLPFEAEVGKESLFTRRAAGDYLSSRERGREAIETSSSFQTIRKKQRHI